MFSSYTICFQIVGSIFEIWVQPELKWKLAFSDLWIIKVLHVFLDTTEAIGDDK